jgi:transketolase
VRSLFHFKAIIPCDPNQTDRAVRYAAETNGNVLVGMGRNRWPVILNWEGKPFFGEGYTFAYGKMDVIRHGSDGAIIAYGGMVYRALKIAEDLSSRGIELSVVNMACVKEIDETVMEGLLSLPRIFTYEDHNVHTGIAPLIARYLLGKGYRGRLESFGVKNYGLSGDTEEVLSAEGLDAKSMADVLLGLMKKEEWAEKQ